MKYRLSNRAMDDMVEIYLYHARFSPDGVDRLEAEFGELFDMLCSSPEMGRDFSPLAPGMRMTPLNENNVYYRIIEETIFISRVIPAAIDFNRIFREYP